jgi:uncharacterized protein (TIGR02001 family)
MKKLMRKIFTFILSLSFATTAVFASDASMAEEEAGPISYNVGFASEYWYRGVYQSESSVSFGADYEANNFYAGTWWADVDQGVEYDIYAGYGFSIGGADLYIGATGYYYSDNFDDDYEEMNAGIAFGPIAIDTSHGEYKKGGRTDGNTKDHNYSFTSIAYDMSGMGLPLTLTYGEWGGSKLKGDVTTLSYGTSVAGADVGLEVGKNSSDITAATTSRADTTYAIFTLGYSF